MLSIKSDEYQQATPFPHIYIDNFLDNNRAHMIQKEILEIKVDEWDRYQNPFEEKYTLRDKFNFPFHLKELFEELESDTFIENLSNMCGYQLIKDTTRNFWGVHTYQNGDKLDIHVDAGIHPTMGLKKQITLGIYLSKNWMESYGCKLELWKGDNAGISTPRLYEKIKEISPIFNRLVIFTCNDYSWHGNPEKVCSPDDAKRIFITISYMSNNTDDLNKRKKAMFISRPSDPEDPEKDHLRFLRADPERYKEIYRIS